MKNRSCWLAAAALSVALSYVAWSIGILSLIKPPSICQAAEKQNMAEKQDLVALMNECQKMSTDPGVITIIQWIPKEWWQLTLKRADVTEARIREVLELFAPYVTFIVVHGRIASSGFAVFTSKSVLQQHIFLEDRAGHVYKPLDDEDLEPGTRNAIVMIKPLFSSMLGQMGDNMNFILFPSESKGKEKLYEATGEGKFSIRIKGIPQVKDQVFQWILPLSSLVPAKFCPKCRQQESGSWKYCPWCGSLLATQ
ncbi:MAG: zinc ribbon domain-containing protein [bacterium]|nr:zinc ribbon domain-containing protein [bacterium]